ncbi:MAG: tetratricopeptide repeat protein, partial [Planctomycetaceae bacterium]|nr:tetratricopeptide repeat protein [Planctomycetaceae bacterium]
MWPNSTEVRRPVGAMVTAATIVLVIVASETLFAQGHGRPNGHSSHGFRSGSSPRLHSSSGSSHFGNAPSGGFSGGHFSGGHYSSDNRGRSVIGIQRGSIHNDWSGSTHRYSTAPNFSFSPGYSFAPSYSTISPSFSHPSVSYQPYPSSGYSVSVRSGTSSARFQLVTGGYVNPAYTGFYLSSPWLLTVGLGGHGFPCRSTYLPPVYLDPYFSYGLYGPYVTGCGMLPSFYGYSLYTSTIPQSSAAYYVMDSSTSLPLLANSNRRSGGTPVNARLPEVPSAPRIVANSDVVRLNDAPAASPLPAAGNETLILEEFPATPVDDRVGSVADRIQSLRNQSTGDDCFRRADYASAEVFYRAAIEDSPDRRAPWLRLAFVSLAQQEFDQAASSLKTGLMMKDDPTSAWVPAQTLYGADADAMTTEHANQLWDWTSQKPLSMDRLLLTAAFQTLRGHDSTAQELLELIRQSENL